VIIRLRPAHDPATLATMYAQPHRHEHLTDHRFRVRDTIEAARGAARLCVSAADLSCGDGVILRSLNIPNKIFGDLAPGYPIVGPIERTIDEIPYVDLFVCCETLEHLDDPPRILRDIRRMRREKGIPHVGRYTDEEVAEHYWAWNQAGVENLLMQAGFAVDSFSVSDHRPSGFSYCFGIWMAS